MSSPYREGLGGAPLSPSEGDDFVTQVAQQFTDPMAFYRELVQNALDAGTSNIRVALSFSEDEGGLLEVRVRDDGSGMDREILEQQLLVLFRSTKEGQKDAIGKFGIGFISVLAVKPQVVQVVTSRGDGVSFRASLFPDHSWEIVESTGGDSSGTLVTLRIALARKELQRFVEDSRDALRRWCKHSSRPIFFGATVGGDVLMAEERIDSPLSIKSVLSVSETVGSTAMVVGLAGRGTLLAEFYNRGLLLREFRAGDVEDLIGAVRFNFAVQDPELEHTLAREDVRRDDAFKRVVTSATNFARRRLAEAALEELATLARTEPLDRRRYGRVLFALSDSQLRFAAERLRVPGLDGQGNTVAHAGEYLRDRAEVFVADGEAEVHSAVVARGHALVDPDACGHGIVPRRPWLEFLSRKLDLGALSLASEYTLAVEEEVSASDIALSEALVRALRGTPRALRSVSFAKLHGQLEDALYVIAKPGQTPPPLETEQKLRRWPRFRLRAPAIMLSSANTLVSAARSASNTELAAGCLARAMLADAGVLDAERELDLARGAIERALEEA